jgi:hypothetical protein
MRGRGSACQPVATQGRARHAAAVARKDEEREKRLAAALRDNLRRRKAQAREAPRPDNGKPEE